MKEKIYDDQINPLMAKIIAICRENNIAFIANFRLGEDLACTSADLRDECSPSDGQLEALKILRPRQAFAMAITEETLPSGDKKISIRRIS